jgi:hypothetical protein
VERSLSHSLLYLTDRISCSTLERRLRAPTPCEMNLDFDNANHQSQSLLFQLLPTEIRLLIYEAAIDEGHIILSPNRQCRLEEPGFLRSCKRMRFEAGEVFWKSTRVIYSADPLPDVTRSDIPPCRLRALDLLRNYAARIRFLSIWHDWHDNYGTPWQESLPMYQNRIADAVSALDGGSNLTRFWIVTMENGGVPGDFGLAIIRAWKALKVHGEVKVLQSHFGHKKHQMSKELIEELEDSIRVKHPA